MATVNKRVYRPQATVINSVQCGGTVTIVVEQGHENIMRSSPDGIGGPPIIDREAQFCRGVITIQDWIEAVNLLTGTVGTLVFYERKSGTAAATGYTKHTFTNPVIHAIALRINKAGYATVAASFECKAADETKTIADMHAMDDSQSAPTYIPAARGAYRVTSAAHGDIDIYHVMTLGLTIALKLVKACNDADVAYTCVDAIVDGMSVNGSISFQDSEITSAKLKVQQLLLASAADLVLELVQSAGAAAKTLTIANVIFNSDSENSDVNADFTEYSLNYEVTNDADTPITLDGANKIVSIA
jgi:hypothetical protein